MDLIDTTEMYLRTIYELGEEGVVPMRARIAERLGHSGPTVSQTVGRMERDGLLHVRADRHLELTRAGRAKAVAVMRKHRLAERLLTDIIGLDWELAHEEACRWEHVIGEQVERRLVGLLDGRAVSPFGNPIPGLAALGLPPESTPVPIRENRVDNLAQLAERKLTSVRLVRIGETVQSDAELLAELAAGGLRPGTVVTLKPLGDGAVGVTAEGGTAVWLSPTAARSIFAQPVTTHPEPAHPEPAHS